MTLQQDQHTLKPQDIRYLVVHCSDTDPDLTAADIHAMHLEFGWDGIGYHAVIRADGTVEKGRPHFWRGAHVYGHNTESLGVCLIGREDFGAEQMQALRHLLDDWKALYPAARICGHRELSSSGKTCPNFDVADWYQAGDKAP